jgi:acetoin utilization protein AcuB
MIEEVDMMRHHKSQVQDFMTETPLVTTPGMSLVDAYNTMTENDIRRMPVVEDDELVGIVTMSDILRSIPNIVAEEQDEETRLTLVARTVREVMAADPITVTPEDSIQDAADLMLEYQVSGLPVVQDTKVVGIITESDIFRLVVESWSSENREASNNPTMYQQHS